HMYYGESIPYGNQEEAYKNASTLSLLTNELLEAWMRLKYPHISIGALVSSAPILRFEDVVSSKTFYAMRESVSCFNTIKTYWDIIELEAHRNNGLSHLT
ncbi:uncharacterized protein, partial [Henckelia pumila]|uniref:uncharacterized protein n=1 Tax=Henckelia pumila TaxID=405737 RepID=UPI003C6DE3E7